MSFLLPVFADPRLLETLLQINGAAPTLLAIGAFLKRAAGRAVIENAQQVGQQVGQQVLANAPAAEQVVNAFPKRVKSFCLNFFAQGMMPGMEIMELARTDPQAAGWALFYKQIINLTVQYVVKPVIEKTIGAIGDWCTQLAYMLEKYQNAAKCIQANIRGFLARRDFVPQVAALHIQTGFRGFLARRNYGTQVAARSIQKGCRGFLARRNYVKHVAAKRCQSVGRGFLGRRRARRRKKDIQRRIDEARASYERTNSSTHLETKFDPEEDSDLESDWSDDDTESETESVPESVPGSDDDEPKCWGKTREAAERVRKNKHVKCVVKTTMKGVQCASAATGAASCCTIS